MVMPRLLDVRIEVYVRTATSTRTDGVSDATLMPVPGNLEAAAATPRSAIPEHADGVSTRRPDESMPATGDTGCQRR